MTRSGFVALAGRPNVGKSTLVNAIVQDKVAIVSDRPQTTRRAIRGVANGPGWQLVLVDLPGVQRPRDALTERMARRVTLELAGADAALMLDRIGQPDPRDPYWLPAHDGSFLDGIEDGVKGWKIAYSPDLGYARVDPEIAASVAKAAKRFEELGAVPKGSTQAELAAFLQSEIAKWGPVIREAKIRVEN